MPLKILTATNNSAFQTLDINRSLVLTNLFSGSANLPPGGTPDSVGVRITTQIPVDVVPSGSCGTGSQIDQTQGDFKIIWRGEYTGTFGGVRGFPTVAAVPTLGGRDSVGIQCGTLPGTGNAERDNFSQGIFVGQYPDMEVLRADYGLPERVDSLPEIYVRCKWRLDTSQPAGGLFNVFMDTYLFDSSQNAPEAAVQVDGMVNGINARQNRVWNLNFWIYNDQASIDRNQITSRTGGVVVARDVIINGINHDIVFKLEDGGGNNFFYVGFVMIPPPGITNIQDVKFRYNDYVSFLNSQEFWDNYVQTNPLNSVFTSGYAANFSGSAGQQLVEAMANPDTSQQYGPFVNGNPTYTRRALIVRPTPHASLVLGALHLGMEMWGTHPGSGFNETGIIFDDGTIEVDGFPVAGLNATQTSKQAGLNETTSINTELNYNTVAGGFSLMSDPNWVGVIPKRYIISGNSIIISDISSYIANNDVAHDIVLTGNTISSFSHNEVTDTLTFTPTATVNGDSIVTASLTDPVDGTAFDVVDINFGVVAAANTDANSDNIRDDSYIVGVNRSTLLDIKVNDDIPSSSGTGFNWAPGAYYKASGFIPVRLNDAGRVNALRQFEQIKDSSAWQGFCIVVSWSLLEPEYREYDFRYIEAFRELCIAFGKQLAVHVIHSTPGPQSVSVSPNWIPKIDGTNDVDMLSVDARTNWIELLSTVGTEFNGKINFSLLEGQDIWFEGMGATDTRQALQEIVEQVSTATSGFVFSQQMGFIGSEVNNPTQHNIVMTGMESLHGVAVGMPELLATRRSDATPTYPTTGTVYPLYEAARLKPNLAVVATITTADIYPFAAADYTPDQLVDSTVGKNVEVEFKPTDLMEIANLSDRVGTSILLVEGGNFLSGRPHGDIYEMSEKVWLQRVERYLLSEVNLRTSGIGTIPVFERDLSTLVFNIESAPENGTAASVNGSILYTPNANYTGYDSFTYSVMQGAQNFGIAQVNLAVSTSADTGNAPATLVKSIKDLYVISNQEFVIDNISEVVSNTIEEWAVRIVGADSQMWDSAADTLSFTVTSDTNLQLRLTDTLGSTIYDVENFQVTAITGASQDQELDGIRDDSYVVSAGSQVSLPVPFNDSKSNGTMTIVDSPTLGSASVIENTDIQYQSFTEGLDEFRYRFGGDPNGPTTRSIYFVDLGGS